MPRLRPTEINRQMNQLTRHNGRQNGDKMKMATLMKSEPEVQLHNIMTVLKGLLRLLPIKAAV